MPDVDLAWPSVWMDHDLHRIIEFLLERIWNSIVLNERYAAKTELTLNHGERNWLKAGPLTRSIDANPRVDFEPSSMPAASERFIVRIEKRPGPDIKPNALMRADVHITEIFLRIFPARPRSERGGFLPPR